MCKSLISTHSSHDVADSESDFRPASGLRDDEHQYRVLPAFKTLPIRQVLNGERIPETVVGCHDLSSIAMISQFIILGPRGDVLVFFDYTYKAPKESRDIFFRIVNTPEKNEDPVPVFVRNGISYIWTRISGLFFIFTTQSNTFPALLQELLRVIAHRIKDIIGILGEEVIRKNPLAVHEIVSELIDNGAPQATEAERLSERIHSDPPTLDSKSYHLASTTPNNRTVGDFEKGGAVGATKREEIFVDVLETIHAVFDAQSNLLHGQIYGQINLKCFIRDGIDRLIMPLTGDIAFQSAQFHESVDQQAFNNMKQLVLKPPAGEITVMTFHNSVVSTFFAPIKVYVAVEAVHDAPDRGLVYLKFQSRLPDKPRNIPCRATMNLLLPKSVLSARGEHDEKRLAQFKGARSSCSWDEAKRVAKWHLEDFPGGQEITCKFNVRIKGGFNPLFTQEIGPVNVKWTLKQFPCSGLRVTDVDVMPPRDKKDLPARWVRYAAHSNSYSFRIGGLIY